MARTVYGLEAIDQGGPVPITIPVYKIEEEDDGTVWVSIVAQFYDRETAHAFCRAWNGEPGPK